MNNNNKVIWCFALGMLLNTGDIQAQQQSSDPEIEVIEVTAIDQQKENSAPSGDEQHWLEGFHGAVSDTFFNTALWFDSFFANDEEEQANPRSLARIRLGWEPSAANWGEFTQRFRIRLRLPHLENKVDLIFSDDEADASGVESYNNELPITRDLEDERFTAALRVINRDEESSYIDTRIGISGGDIFTRARLKLQTDYTKTHAFKAEPSVYYFLDDGFGSRLYLQYAYTPKLDRQLQINYSISGSESYSGARWRHGLFYFKQHDHRRASVTNLTIEGERWGDNGFEITEYRLGYRYRVNAIRKWLFFEVEPFLLWEDDRNFDTSPGIALRVEGYFTKQSK
ncbi:hypothetical protein [Thalassotalea mangrovi]|uniref:Uncharacterized protein n=1 Tax=Thalassotalea mangrovi TaxID=2572245 RepID=A0A4V5NUF7_9GAMM|nr:hypothetical protein [Thalassotalea mangrovi]TKB46289.1 hypothetical protein E8M12_04345 [Thalassotalea mangrovi]